MNKRGIYLLILIGLSMLISTGAWAQSKRSIFLNGANIDTVRNEVIDNARVEIDAQGNILITASGYKVEEVKPILEAAAKEPARYYLVSDPSHRGLIQYDIDVFINSAWIQRLNDTSPQEVIDITKYLKQGRNIIHLAAVKNFKEPRKSASADHIFRVLIGQGRMTKDNVIFDSVMIDYQRSASESVNFANDFTVQVNGQL